METHSGGRRKWHGFRAAAAESERASLRSRQRSPAVTEGSAGSFRSQRVLKLVFHSGIRTHLRLSGPLGGKQAYVHTSRSVP